MGTFLDDLKTDVQQNCHISDARYAADYTICIYLMKMREFFRWENGLGYQDHLPKDEVGNWLRERESLWESVEANDFLPIKTRQQSFEPFDVDNINQGLNADGYIYGAGLGIGASPHFFLAEMEQRHQIGDTTILVAGRELARDLSSPPAMSQGKTIYIRRESLRRTMWERLENWNWNRPQNAMARALTHFDIEGDLEGALDHMTAVETDTVLHHEFGEVQAGEMLGEEWHDLLISLPRSRVEFMARAVRDLLADSLSTLPHLLEKQDEASLHLYIANLNGMRKELAPGLKQAYDHWIESGDLEQMERFAQMGRDHWLETAQRLVELHKQEGISGMKAMQQMLEQSAAH
ncbi:MAG: hypothetical protein HUJ28_11730 [Chromatiales bacterium]|nr:hypothetical protein [Chromatiales bacterium]